MITLNKRLEDLADELMEVLDEDVCQINLNLERLNRLRSAVIKRDEEGLRVLLNTIREESDEYEQVEIKRHELRRKLADILGCSIEEMNLSKLCSNAPEGKRALVAGRQRELGELMEKLRIEHTCTSMLLKECSRLNKMLLRGIFGSGKETVTYNARGNASWEMQKGIVNFRL